MEHLSDELLIDSFYEAKRLQLSPDFICLLEDELNRRNLSIQNMPSYLRAR